MRPIALLVLLLTAPALFAVELPPSSERWTQMRVGNVTITSSAGDRETRRIALQFLQMRQVIARVTKLDVHAPVPTIVFVFGRQAEFASYRDAWPGEKASTVAGIFKPGGDENLSLVDGSQDVDRTVYHDLTHFLIRNTVPGVPRWLDEGLAEFSSTLVIVGDHVRVGTAPLDHVEFLRSRGLMPLIDLFTRRLAVADPKKETLTGTFDSEAWLLMHYLLVGNPGRGAQLPAFLAALDEGKPVATACQDSFHATPSELDAELRRYLGNSRFDYIEYSSRELGSETLPAPVPLPRDELLFELGDLLLHGQSGDSETFLAASLKLNEHHAAAMTDLAILRARQGKGAEADALLKKSVELAGTDYRPVLTLATREVSALQARARNGEEIPQASIAHARKVASTAARLAPGLARAYGVIGATYTFPGQDVSTGIMMAARSFGEAPGQLNVASDLVQLYAMDGRKAAAEAMIARAVVPSGDEQAVADARERIAVADYQRGVTLLKSGKKAEAVLALRAAGKESVNPQLKMHIRTVLAGTTID